MERKICEVVKKYNIEKSRDAVVLIDQALMMGLPIDKIFSKYSGKMDGNGCKVTKIRASEEGETERGIYYLELRKKKYIIDGRENLGWYVRKAAGIPNGKDD
ncbi:MAG TPA: hypothetical protein VJ343_00245 [archaeon]|nr:hypothetical protein [archaeon]